MSIYTFNPYTRELVTSRPKGVSVPSSAFDLNVEVLPPRSKSPTSPFLVALLITMIVLLLLAFFYLLWLWFVKTPDQRPSDIFSIFTG